jgi:hypothetical protein
MATWSNLTNRQVKEMAATEEDRSGFAVVWPNILWTADLFWQAQLADDQVRQMETWHHLVMATGNFKRQGGTQICLLQTPPSQHLTATRPEMCLVRTLDGQIELWRDEPDSWTSLTNDKKAIKGIQVATATTLLSALWPGSHIIIDIRDLNATIGLNLAELTEWVNPLSRTSIGPSWNWYQWMRDKVMTKAAESRLAPIDVERALYQLDRLVTRPSKGQPKLTWQQYSDALEEVLMLYTQS